MGQILGLSGSQPTHQQTRPRGQTRSAAADNSGMLWEPERRATTQASGAGDVAKAFQGILPSEERMPLYYRLPLSSSRRFKAGCPRVSGRAQAATPSIMVRPWTRDPVARGPARERCRRDCEAPEPRSSGEGAIPKKAVTDGSDKAFRGASVPTCPLARGTLPLVTQPKEMPSCGPAHFVRPSAPLVRSCSLSPWGAGA